MLKKIKDIKTNNFFVFNILNFILALLSLVVFLFIPIIKINLNKTNISLNGAFMLLNNGFLIKTQNKLLFLKFSLFLKFAITFNVMFSVLGFLFITIKKHAISALSHFLCVLGVNSPG